MRFSFLCKKYMDLHYENMPSEIQSTPVISNNRLSRKIWSRFKHEIPTSDNILWKRGEIVFPQYFQYISQFRSKITYSFVKCGYSIYFVLNSVNLICRSTDISKYFRHSLGLRDNKSRLYTENVTTQKWKFSYKNFWYFFHISAQSIDCGYSLELPRRCGSVEYPLCFWAERRKEIMYTPVNPSFII